MSDISTVNNRIIPLDLELYDRVVEEFPDKNVVDRNDAEFKIQFTLKNKNASSPYTVAASDVSGADKIELIFKSPNGITYKRLAQFGSDGSDGIIFYVCQENDLNQEGTWFVTTRVTYGDVQVQYPFVPFVVE